MHLRRGGRAGARMIVSLDFFVTGLVPGLHTFEIHWRVASPEIIAQQRAESWGTNRTLIVMEMN